VLELEVLVWELGAVNALAARAVTLREVATLNHELLDHTVEGRALVAEVFLARGQGTEVLSSLPLAVSSAPARLVARVHYLWHGLAV
jgi:hypothetical protein